MRILNFRRGSTCFAENFRAKTFKLRTFNLKSIASAHSNIFRPPPAIHNFNDYAYETTCKTPQDQLWTAAMRRPGVRAHQDDPRSRLHPPSQQSAVQTLKTLPGTQMRIASYFNRQKRRLRPESEVEGHDRSTGLQ